MVEILGKLFGGAAKVKIMRLFLLNPDRGYELKDVAVRSRVTGASARREVASLAAMGFVKRKNFTKEIEVGRSKKIRTKKVSGWIMNSDFHYITQIKNLLIDAEFLKKEDLITRFKPAGKIKLLITSGVFRQDEESRVDFLLVGDNLKRGYLDQTIKSLEAEIGKELSYAIFTTSDFLYRLNMYDKLVRDILDFPYDKVIDNGQLSTQLLKKS
jgi:hypothetical protein